MPQRSQWWRQFNDPLLTELMDARQYASATVAAAQSRAAPAPLTQASASKARAPPNIPLATTVQAGLQASWKLDLFGGGSGAESAARQWLPSARFSVRPLESGVKMQLILLSEEPVALNVAAQQAERELRLLQGIGHESSSAFLVRPEIIVSPDFARAADLGVEAASIGETVRVATAGDYDTQLTKLNLSGRCRFACSCLTRCVAWQQ